MASTRGHSLGQHAASGALIVVLGAVLAITSWTAAFGMARGTGFAPCLSTNGGWQLTATASGLKMPTVHISGLDPASCDGLITTVQVSGNVDGDQAAPANLVLATWKSDVNPCFGGPDSTGAKVVNGAITVSGCSSDYPTISQITQFRVTVGTTTEVLGDTYQHQNGTSVGSGSPSPATATDGLLPFTGSWSEFLTRIGLLAVLAGCILSYLGRRRDRRSHGGPPQ